MELLADRLDRFWSPVRHLNSVMNSPDIRKAYNAGIKQISNYSTELGQNRAIYEQFEAIRKSDKYTNLSLGQQKSLDDTLRDFRLSGVSLDDKNKNRFKVIALQLSELTTRFAENVLDSTSAWTKLVSDEKELTGLPEHAREAAFMRAKEKTLEGWLLES